MDLGSHRFYFWAHTDLTDLTVFALVVGNLTDALRRFAPKAHTDSTDSTDLSSRNFYPLNLLNLCEIYFNNSVGSV